MTPYEQTLDDSCGKEKLALNRNKPPAEPDSGMGSYLLQISAHKWPAVIHCKDI